MGDAPAQRQLTELRRAAHRITGAAGDLQPLVQLARNAHFVLLGEASHGTHEFYSTRAEITRRLISEHGLRAVAIEGDWPDAYRVNCYVKCVGDDSTPEEALRGFQRFPPWMWRNRVVEEFVGWLREHNEKLPPSERVGFYGMDLYSLYGSIAAVLRYLERIDPEAATRARYRYSCFEDFGEDSQAYGYAATVDASRSCEDEAVRQLGELRLNAAEYIRSEGRVAADEFFFAEQNARLVKNAEEYYRSMFRGRVSSWNLRDRHMVETLGALRDHLRRESGSDPAIAVWAHNSHLGDARATEMGRRGELNVGQLVRQRYGDDVVLIGFTTYTGTVTAADDWDEPARFKRVRPGLGGSYEALLHDVGEERFAIVMRGDEALAAALAPSLLERAIGVIYRPETERTSHYFHASLPAQFDAMIHLDETRALEPLERTAHLVSAEVPETYPTAL